MKQQFLLLCLQINITMHLAQLCSRIRSCYQYMLDIYASMATYLPDYRM